MTKSVARKLVSEKQDLLLTLMVEEGCEAIHELCKGSRFGFTTPCVDKNNTTAIERFRVELIDLWVVTSLLVNDDADFISASEFSANHDRIVASIATDNYTFLEVMSTLMLHVSRIDDADCISLDAVKQAVLYVWAWVSNAMAAEGFVDLAHFRNLRLAKRSRLRTLHPELFEVG